MKHLLACVELAQREEVPDLVLHAFTDGRDSPPTCGAQTMGEADAWLRDAGGRVASVSGRYYAMDRDRRWQRTAMAGDALVRGETGAATRRPARRPSGTPTRTARPTSSSSRPSWATRG